MISNAELMLLHLLESEGSMSGYEINRLVEQRGFREWADVGMTSIYVSLNKLLKKEYVSFQLDTNKKGKGPVPKIYSLEEPGIRTLTDEVYSAVTTVSQQKSRFRLGLAAISLFTPEARMELLNSRKSALESHLYRLQSEIYPQQGGDSLPLEARWQFQYSFNTLQMEIAFADKLLRDLSEA
ncbi:hypothetical protein VINI7043_09135 [Vibrio nigripulchritudo ATCC 27043]|nr:hypothetical protein VINI7043_09135 [Vibrio nigripulchritudo ATCC 27043]